MQLNYLGKVQPSLTVDSVVIWGEGVVSWHRQVIATAVKGIDGSTIGTHTCQRFGQHGQWVGVQVFPSNLQALALRQLDL